MGHHRMTTSQERSTRKHQVSYVLKKQNWGSTTINDILADLFIKVLPTTTFKKFIHQIEMYQLKDLNIEMRKQRLCLVKKNTQKGGGGGWIGFLKYFQSQQIQTQCKQNKEIEFREFKLGFIVVRHFLAYVHSPQSPNRVRVPLT